MECVRYCMCEWVCATLYMYVAERRKHSTLHVSMPRLITVNAKLHSTVLHIHNNANTYELNIGLTCLPA